MKNIITLKKTLNIVIYITLIFNLIACDYSGEFNALKNQNNDLKDQNNELKNFITSQNDSLLKGITKKNYCFYDENKKCYEKSIATYKNSDYTDTLYFIDLNYYFVRDTGNDTIRGINFYTKLNFDTPDNDTLTHLILFLNGYSVIEIIYNEVVKYDGNGHNVKDVYDKHYIILDTFLLPNKTHNININFFLPIFKNKKLFNYPVAFAFERDNFGNEILTNNYNFHNKKLTKIFDYYCSNVSSAGVYGYSKIFIYPSNNFKYKYNNLDNLDNLPTPNKDIGLDGKTEEEITKNIESRLPYQNMNKNFFILFKYKENKILKY